MKQLLVILCTGVLFTAACGDSAREEAEPIDSASEIEGYTAAASDFPTVIPDAYAPWALMTGDAYPSIASRIARQPSGVSVKGRRASYNFV